ncbi:NAD-dependent protein deacetylase Sirt2 isoform X2 [Ceratitis capitata]|uniref:NAD-dependent protein deacetylase n=1 Tax=Ceratitis capitata TaxID=7213 RepID=W8CBS6_CERCA|nr:NAD-dependent protein deacetylase Sirt2 isoform X2 [Ceratitis capitata]
MSGRDSPGPSGRESQEVLETIRVSLTNLFSRLALHPDQSASKVIPDLSFDGFLSHWKSNGFKKIVTMVGAGISTSAGIPDFRTPGSGLYDNLQKYNLPHPTDIFELDYFIENPKPFYALAKELYPGNFRPTPVHYFIRLLNEKNLLVRHYTQNIDSLERLAGLPEEKMVEAHGTFHTNHCLECGLEFSKEWMKEKIFSDTIPLCDACNGIVKPDIVFFGEGMPDKFYDMPAEDFKNCDLLIVMGTSLEVYPFASLVGHAEPNCLRVLINRTSIDKFGSPTNKRDINFIGDCDDAVWKMAEALGWSDELKALIKKEGSKFEKPKVRTSDNKHNDDKKPKTSREVPQSNQIEKKS